MMKTYKIRLVILAILLLGATLSVYAAFREERKRYFDGVAFLDVGQGRRYLY